MQEIVKSEAQVWCAEKLRLLVRPVRALIMVAIVAAVVACGGGSESIPPLPGALDATFGVANDGTPDGVVNLSLGQGNDYASAIAVQSDGKIVVAGTSSSSGGTTSNIVVERFNTDGTLDTTFGIGNDDGSPDGVVSLDLGVSSDIAKAVAIQSDGKIIVAGTSTANSSNIVLARLNTNGSLDTSFGAGNADGTPDGVVSLSLGDGDDVANALAIQADGKIVVAGTTTSIDTSSNIVVARLNTNGSLDISFGAGNIDGTPDGVVSVSLGDGDDAANAMAIQADGKIVVAGTTTSIDTSSNIAVVRLNTNGSLDISFGPGNVDGTPDGVVSVSLGEGDDVAKAISIQSNGMILVAGTTTSLDKTSNIAVVRMNADGSLDVTFGAGTTDGTPDGVASFSLGAGNDIVNSLTIQTDGKIIVAGTTTSTGSTSNIALARLKTDGSLDAAFGRGNADGTPDGVISLSLGEGNDFANALTLQSDGKILIAGDRIIGSSSDIVLVRIIAN
jgi:uncharacterized delta-60 repeat protein